MFVHFVHCTPRKIRVFLSLRVVFCVYGKQKYSLCGPFRLSVVCLYSGFSLSLFPFLLLFFFFLFSFSSSCFLFLSSFFFFSFFFSSSFCSGSSSCACCPFFLCLFLPFCQTLLFSLCRFRWCKMSVAFVHSVVVCTTLAKNIGRATHVKLQARACSRDHAPVPAGTRLSQLFWSG